MTIDTQAILEAALFCPTSEGWGLPLCFLSEPGAAKSSKLRKIGRKYGWHTEILSPSVRGMGAFGVVPVPTGTGAAMRVANPSPAWSDNLALGGLVVVDEFTTVGGEIQAAMLGLMAEKIIGATKLGDSVRVIALANPVDMAANGHDIAPPLANRVGWIDWAPPSTMEHGAYLASCAALASERTEETDDAEAKEARVVAAWGPAMAGVAALCAGFHQSQPGWKNKMPDAGDPARNLAWPSDRTWEFAARSMAIGKILGLGKDEIEAMVKGFVGDSAKSALYAYAKDNALPPLEDILDGKVAFAHNPRRVDLTLTVLTGGIGMVTPKNAPNRMPRAEVLWRLLEAVGAVHADFLEVFGNQLINTQLLACAEATRVIMAITATKKAK